MATMDCGCWSGPWHAIIPPPKCDFHASRIWAGADLPLPGITRGPSITPALTPDERRATTINSINEMLATGKMDVTENRSPDPLSEGLGCMLALARQLITLRNGSSWEKNPAAHDSWQLAVELLAPVLAAIERARKAEAGSEG